MTLFFVHARTLPPRRTMWGIFFIFQGMRNVCLELTTCVPSYAKPLDCPRLASLAAVKPFATGSQSGRVRAFAAPFRTMDGCCGADNISRKGKENVSRHHSFARYKGLPSDFMSVVPRERHKEYLCSVGTSRASHQISACATRAACAS